MNAQPKQEAEPEQTTTRPEQVRNSRIARALLSPEAVGPRAAQEARAVICRR